MARPGASFNAVIGRKRIASSISESVAFDTRSARASMKGVIDNYRKIVAHIEQSTPHLLYDALEPTFKKSQYYCPFRTGAMRSSGYLEITEFRGKPRVEIGYGRGGSPEYTAMQHENLEFKHKEPTRAKWLQTALEEDSGEIRERIIDAYRRMFT